MTAASSNIFLENLYELTVILLLLVSAVVQAFVDFWDETKVSDIPLDLCFSETRVKICISGESQITHVPSDTQMKI